MQRYIHRRNREYIRIMSGGESHPLMDLLRCTVRAGLQFCPLHYLPIISIELERGFKGCKIEARCSITAGDLIKPVNISCADIRDIK